MRSHALFLGSLALCASASASALVHPGYKLFESLPAVPEGWKKLEDRPSGGMRQLFRIALKQPHAAQFEQTVFDISTPGHPKYGQHMSREELKAMLRPSDDVSDAVLTWLKDEGIAESDIKDDGDWINFYATIAEAETLFDTKFSKYRSWINDITLVRTLQYSIPKQLHEYVQMIQPTIRFGQVRPQRSFILEHFRADDEEAVASILADFFGDDGGNQATTVAPSCNTTVTPSCIRELYGLGNFTAPSTNATLGISGYLEEYAKFKDLSAFLEDYAPYASGSNFSWVSVNGGLLTQDDQSDDDVEANLDIQYALSLSYPTHNVYYSTGGRGELIPDLDQPYASDNSNEPYLDFLHYILALPDSDLPTTLTTSYGEDEQSVPQSYANSTCSLFAQLGARGVSVIFSSGDTGVGSGCLKNDGSNSTAFLPTFPAGCPFVTAVGGTYHVEPERAVSFSSGGFSEYWSRPSYQDDAVTAYLDILGDKWQGLYNPQGRGIPDVAAQAYNFSVYDTNEGGVIRVGGTSASAPTFAAIISNVNSVLISQGYEPLGFLNPWIYSTGKSALTDITVGGSKGCTGTDSYSGLSGPYVPHASWNATDGWDPVTGYGTPQFDKLVDLALAQAQVSSATYRITSKAYEGARRLLESSRRW